MVNQLEAGPERPAEPIPTRCRHRPLRSGSVATAVLQFAGTGAVVVLLLGLAAVTLLRSTGTSEAIGNAKQLTRLAGDGVVGPAITPALERGEPAAIAAMDRLVRGRIVKDPVVRVKIWDARGRIVYSDEHRLIGSSYPLRSDELAALRNGTADAEVSDLARPENRFERQHRKLLEVYLGVRTRDGGRALFESYQRFSSISASGQRVWERFLPALAGAMVLLWLAQIPLAWSLARRVRRGQREREALLRRAIDASDVERRRIAAELHDSAVQNLAGLSYNLSAAAAQLPPGSPVRDSVQEGASQARRTVRELRTLLVDIYPAALHRSGLEPALIDLADASGGTQIRLDVQPGLELPRDVEALVFRAAQEAVRNIRTHSGASSATLAVTARDDLAVLEVSDDGRGFDPGGVAEDHFGLRVLTDLARDAGGSFSVDARPGAGTRIRLEVPLP